ncbi:hypothetical protein BH20ACT24_BH20ACT24_23440 [soil metagenome]
MTNSGRIVAAMGALCVLAGACVGEGEPGGAARRPISGPSPGASASAEASVGVPVSGTDWEVTVTGAHAETRLPANEQGAPPIQPANGNLFLIVDADLRPLGQDAGAEVRFSSEDAFLIGEDGVEHPSDGAGEDGFCVDCVVDLSTSDERLAFSFVFALPADSAQQAFGFRYADAPPVQVTFDPEPIRAVPDDHSDNLELVGSSPEVGLGLGPDFASSDLAFWGDLAFEGNYDGFRILDVSDPAAPEEISQVTCRTRQGDVSVWDGLLFLSVDRPQTRKTCESIDTSASNEGAFEGIRIFDVSDPREPRFLAGVATDCGSHTHTLYPDLENGRILLYVSSYAPTEENLGPNCSNPFGRISVVEVPLDAPEEARVAAEPRLVDTPVHDWPSLPDGSELPFENTAGCHDIQVFVELRLAAAACMSEGQLWDISEPLRPRTIAHIDAPTVEFWHSAAFTWDGEIVAFGDETFFSRPGCRTPEVGSLWFYRVSDPSEPLGHFDVPRPQGEEYPCSYHEFNVVPVADRYVLVASAYGAGTSVVDFTDPGNAREIAYYDAQSPEASSAWAAYWYNGHIFTSDEGTRGLDVFSLDDPAVADATRFEHLNPQTQEEVLMG